MLQNQRNRRYEDFQNIEPNDKLRLETRIDHAEKEKFFAVMTRNGYVQWINNLNSRII
jgi:hypothetical protein